MEENQVLNKIVSKLRKEFTLRIDLISDKLNSVKECETSEQREEIIEEI